MTPADFQSVAIGWSHGFSCATNKKEENEVKQGKNYLLAVPMQWEEVRSACAIASRIANHITYPPLQRIVKTICRLAPLIAFPFLALTGTVKQGIYTQVASWWVGKSTSILRAHTGNAIRVALVVIGLEIGGSFALASLAYCGYKLIRFNNILSANVLKAIDSLSFYNSLERLYNPTARRLASLLRLPNNLSKRQLTVASQIGEHAGDYVRAAMIVGGIALLYLGDFYCGIPLFFSIAFEALDTSGYVPFNVSIFMEQHMPKVSSLTFALESTSAIGQIYWGSMFLLSISTYFYQRAQQIFEGQLHGKIVIEQPLHDYPTLAAIEAPIVSNRNLCYNQIRKILFAEDDEYVINPAHCSKSFERKLPRDNEFGKLRTFFDKVRWEDLYHGVVKRKLRDDQRFIDMLATKFSVTPAEAKADFDIYIEEVAEENNNTIEKFAADWLKAQMDSFVSVLEGSRRIIGRQQELVVLRNISPIVIAYLSGISAEQRGEQVEFQDTLLKIACEAGNYCGRGARRAMSEIVEGISTTADSSNEPTPCANYESELYQTLSDLRRTIVNSNAAITLGKMASSGLEGVSHDVHTYDMIRQRIFGLGMVPFFKQERESLNFLDICLWTIGWGPLVLPRMYTKYDPDTVFATIGEVKFSQYIREVIKANTRLSDPEKDGILSLYTEANEGSWDVRETNKRFHRLALVMLGVLKESSV